MNVQGARIAGVVRFPDFLEQRFAFHHFAVLVHEDAEKGHQARGEFCVLAQASHALVFEVELNGSCGDHVVAVAGQERLDPVDEFLDGEGKRQHGVCEILFDAPFLFEDQDDGKFRVPFADGVADADARAPQRGGVDYDQAGVDLFDLRDGLAPVLEGTNIKSLLLQIGSKRRDFCVASFDDQ